MAKKGTPEYDAWLVKYNQAKALKTATTNMVAQTKELFTKSLRAEFDDHDFSKTNLFTQAKRGQTMHDTYKCKSCGVTGKRYGLQGFIILDKPGVPCKSK